MMTLATQINAKATLGRVMGNGHDVQVPGLLHKGDVPWEGMRMGHDYGGPGVEKHYDVPQVGMRDDAPPVGLQMGREVCADQERARQGQLPLLVRDNIWTVQPLLESRPQNAWLKTFYVLH
ncbi:hypothetical protein Droror1_Dr00000921 [Drosera rotundifolia]